MKKKQITIEDLGYQLTGLSGEQKTFVEKNAEMVCAVVNKAMEGMLTSDEVEEKFETINDQLKDYIELKTQNTDLCTQVKALSESLEKMKKKGIQFDLDAFRQKFDEIFSSDRWEGFVNGRKDSTGLFNGLALKELVAVSMTDNYQGDVLVSRQEQSPVVRDLAKTLHIRDIIPVLPGDPANTNIVWPLIYWMDRNARFVSENGALPKSSFKIKEESTSVTRLGTQIDLSRRMLKSRAYVMAYVISMLPEAVYMAEDWSILFGNGSGNNLKGITAYDGVVAIEKLISEAVVEGDVKSIKSIEPYGTNSVVVTFVQAYDLIKDGMTITLSGCTNTALNASHALVKLNDQQVLIKNVSINAVDTAAPTTGKFTVNMSGYKNIEFPNSEDVIRTGAAVMSFGQYRPRAIVLNPATVNMIESEKDSIGRPLGLIKNVNGVKTTAGLPIIEFPGIAPGEYLMGDFKNGAALIDYTNLGIEFADDVTYKSQNMVAALAAEEIILQVRMPFAFSHGKLEALREAITKPAPVVDKDDETKQS